MEPLLALASDMISRKSQMTSEVMKTITQFGWNIRKEKQSTYVKDS